MGNLSEKIKYLLETKKLIKEAILDMGVVVYNTDTFRDYVDKIRNISIKRDKIQIQYIVPGSAEAVLHNGKVFNSSIIFKWVGDGSIAPNKGYLVFPNGNVEEISNNYKLTASIENRGDYKIIIGNYTISFRIWWNIREDFIESNGNKIKLKRLNEIKKIDIYDWNTDSEFTFKELTGIELPASGEYEFFIERPGDYDISIYVGDVSYELFVLVE